MADFCKQFNEATKTFDKDVPIPVVLSAFSNRTFTFVCKTPPTSWFLMQCAGIKNGAKRPGHEVAGKVHVKQIYEIGLIKQKEPHMAHKSLESICRSIVGSCVSMGIDVVGKDGQ
jgi:large subunit ribosomal protein L11